MTTEAEATVVDPNVRAPLLTVRDLVKTFPVGPRRFGRRATQGGVQAVAGISFELDRGETLSLVGESGCGKSTVARCVIRLLAATSGSVCFAGTELTELKDEEVRLMRRHFQMVFQDPQASLNPRMSVGEIVAEPLVIHGTAPGRARQRAADLLDLVQLGAHALDRHPHQFSGGQRQRIGIARALALSPQLVILDEPVSALDVSIQAEITRLLLRLKNELDLAYLFIAHDLAVVRHVADRVAVMYLGKIVEVGTNEEVYRAPAHPYTHALLSAAPIPDPRRERERQRIVLTGDVPNPADPPSGCRFRTRCWKAQELCSEREPELVDRGFGHPVACHFPEIVDVLTRTRGGVREQQNGVTP